MGRTNDALCMSASAPEERGHREAVVGKLPPVILPQEYCCRNCHGREPLPDDRSGTCVSRCVSANPPGTPILPVHGAGRLYAWAYEANLPTVVPLGGTGPCAPGPMLLVLGVRFPKAERQGPVGFSPLF